MLHAQTFLVHLSVNFAQDILVLVRSAWTSMNVIAQPITATEVQSALISSVPSHVLASPVTLETGFIVKISMNVSERVMIAAITPGALMQSVPYIADATRGILAQGSSATMSTNARMEIIIVTLMHLARTPLDLSHVFAIMAIKASASMVNVEILTNAARGLINVMTMPLVPTLLVRIPALVM
jgi:hypothetical protein